METPLMKQYYQVKKKHPDAILLFRVGDFYETFEQDAIRAAEILGITLTKRANGAASYVELAGFPHHALDNYLPKLVRAGQRVAICEQLEDPKATKKIVKRGVTEMVTPGVSVNDNVLEHRENNFLAGVHFHKKQAGVAFLDISTGEYYVAEGGFEYIDKLLQSFKPKEVLYERKYEEQFTEHFGSKFYRYKLDDWMFTGDAARDRLLKQFGTSTLKGFGIDELELGTIAAGCVLHYLDLTQHQDLGHITSLSRIEEGQHVWLDRFTIRNLELFTPINPGGKTLIEILDQSRTAMGARLLKRWLALPLKEPKQINSRLEVVEYLMKTPDERDQLAEHISEIGDMERLASKVSLGRINPREVLQLHRALSATKPLKEICESAGNDSLKSIGEQLNNCRSIHQRIENELMPDPPVLLSKGNVINDGVDSELDEYRNMLSNGKQYLRELQERESKRTGIPSLKVAFNNVFGYYLEVRNTHKDKVPEDWVRKQTLVSAERYITEELKEFETKILTAEENILSLETHLFGELVQALAEYIPALQLNASLLARLDCLLSFEQISRNNKYNRPVVDDSLSLDIRQGRHPVIEQMLPPDQPYVANDVSLDNNKQQMIIITGPNMSGKSALLRQTALITLMAQCGCFVPAEKVQMGVVDKIFTRVGASDNISLGESTFMVEMHEAASILNNLSERSLVLLDELGRGTSTYDGISIAWAIAEYIHERSKCRAKTLFATHYHELNEMENSFKRIHNWNVSVKETGDKVIFLRKLVRGGSEHSFGIHVARMAGMPRSVVKRAEEILKDLEGGSKRGNKLEKRVENIAQNREGFQTTIFQLDDPVLQQVRDEIAGIDINSLTPMDALNKLYEIKKHLGLDR